MDRIALISDVHGNLTALEAVLADIDERGIARVLNLGDYVGKGPRGADCVERCIERCEVNIRGNWDDFIPALGDDAGAAMRWWRDELKPEHLPWLATLPLAYDLVISGRRVRLFHASSTSVHQRVRVSHTAEEFAAMFENTPLTGRWLGHADVEPDVVVYGDIHETFLHASGGRTLVNAGSVGNHLDDPTAAYVVVEGVVGSAEPAPFGLQFVRVPYDIEGELAVARDRGVPEYEGYAVELREGMYRGDWRKLRAASPTDPNRRP